MGAGDSAREMAQRAERSAAEHERRASKARERAARYAAGAVGEEQLAAALQALEGEGWRFLHDRVNPNGGNIDTIAVDPGGVIVMDAKAWTGELVADGDRLKSGNWSRTKALDAVRGQATAVQGAIDDEYPVSCGLLLTEQPDWGPAWPTNVTVCGTAHLRSGLAAMSPVMSLATVDRLASILELAFPPMGTIPSKSSGLRVVEPDETTVSFERGHRVVYLHSWPARQPRRIYLKDQSGNDLGHRDLVNDQVRLDPAADHPFAHVLLAAATSTGLQLDHTALPKVPLTMPGGRLMGTFGKLWTSVLIGQRGNGPNSKRMYGTLANPSQGVFKLGHVDLDTGWVKPTSDGPLTEQLGPADCYLARLRDLWPDRPAPQERRR